VTGCCRVKDPGSPGFSRQAAAVLLAVEQSQREGWWVFLLAPVGSSPADCSGLLLPRLWGSGEQKCWAALELQTVRSDLQGKPGDVLRGKVEVCLIRG